MTFKEAYLRTGRILNVSVVPADRYSYVLKLLFMTLLTIALQTYQIVELYHSSRYSNLECFAGIRSRSRYSQPCSPYAKA